MLKTMIVEKVNMDWDVELEYTAHAIAGPLNLTAIFALLVRFPQSHSLELKALSR
jgi:hypothetical protein